MPFVQPILLSKMQEREHNLEVKCRAEIVRHVDVFERILNLILDAFAMVRQNEILINSSNLKDIKSHISAIKLYRTITKNRIFAITKKIFHC